MSEELRQLQAQLDGAQGEERADILLRIVPLLARSAPPEALAHASEVLQLARAAGSPRLEARAMKCLGLLSLDRGDHAEAMQHLLAGLRIADATGDAHLQSWILSDLGAACSMSGDTTRALDYLDRARRLHEGSDDLGALAGIETMMGLIRSREGDPAAAREHFERALELARRGGIWRMEGSILGNIGVVLSQEGRHEEACDYHERACELNRECGDERGLAGALVNIGIAHLGCGRLGEAQEHLERGLELTEALRTRDYQLTALQNLTRLHEARGDYTRAFEVQARCIEVAEELRTLEKDRSVAHMEARYEAEKARRAEQEAELQRLKTVELAEKNRQIQEQKAELERLNARKDEFLTRILHHIDDGILLADPSGRALYANDRFLEITGFDRPDLDTLRLESYVAPEWLQRVREVQQRALQGEETPGRIELVGRRRDGGRMWLEASIVPVSQEGEVVGTQSLIRDISERRALQEQVCQAQKMEAVGSLAGGIAHDFNNLLTAIGGYAELGALQVEQDHAIRSSLREIRLAADRAASLTRQLLTVGRRQRTHPEPLSLNSVIEDVQALLRKLVGPEILLSLDLEPDLGLVLADQSQIEQVLLNLAINARDAMAGTGRLRVVTRNVLPGDSPLPQVGLEPGPHVELRVEDEGCGMDEGTRSRIFEPYFTTKAGDRGTGLGLSTAHGIVKQSGGEIAVESEPGVGTTFRIYLPRTDRQPAPAATPEAIQTPAMGSGTILVVEDDPSILTLAKEVLSGHGYHVLVACTGEEALGQMQAHDGVIDLLLTDLVLPGISGLETARMITRRMPRPRVLYTSGYNLEELRRWGFDDSQSTFLEKPFGPAALLHAVEDALCPLPESVEGPARPSP